MSLCERNRAFADQLCEEPGAIRFVESVFAERVVRGMTEECLAGDGRFAVAKIVEIIGNAHPMVREDLLSKACEKFSARVYYNQFVCAIFEVAKRCGAEEEVFPPVFIRSIFAEPWAFDFLFVHRDLVGDEENPLFKWIVCDRHWEQRVAYHMANRDFLRAWECLKRAIGGWLSVQALKERKEKAWEQMENLGESLNRDHRCLMASMPVAKRLVSRLFEAMSDAGLVSAKDLAVMQAQDYVYRSRTTPGLSYARLFAQQARAGEGLPFEYYAILKMADHFSKAKIERRKARRAKAKV